MFIHFVWLALNNWGSIFPNCLVFVGLVLVNSAFYPRMRAGSIQFTNAANPTFLAVSNEYICIYKYIYVCVYEHVCIIPLCIYVYIYAHPPPPMIHIFVLKRGDVEG